MRRCDVLVVGGGPAGSTLARALTGDGLDVVVQDRATFPRDKICAGWITPQILDELQIDPGEYGRERVIQPILGFRFARMGDAAVEVRYPAPVSWGIRRSEFDDWLLQRCGAERRLGEPVESIARENRDWVVNGAVRARVLAGAGGHFCPVARLLAPAEHSEPVVVAREIEFEMTPEQRERCPVRGEVPELFFTPDLRGYGWIFRKGDWLNVGLGRQDARGFPAHLERFIAFLEEENRLPPDVPRRLRGHAYLLWDQAPRPLAADGVLLAGDAAGLAYPKSGEGIRPAIESALLAASAIHDALDGARAGLAGYPAALERRFGPRVRRPGLAGRLPERWLGPLAGALFARPWFARHVLADRWFLHRDEPALARLPAPFASREVGDAALG